MYATRMSEGQHLASARHKPQLGLGQRSAQLRVFCREPAVVGKEGQFFSIVAELLAGEVRANAYSGCFGFAHSAFLGTSAVFP